MRYSTIALAAMPGFFALASGLGTFTIKNSCGTDIHYVHDVNSCETVLTVPAGSSSDPCTYQTKADGSGGPSVKMALETTICSATPPPITQFEYTVGWAEKVFTDLSNINGIPYPFMEGGVKLTSSDNSVSVSCAAGIEDCTAAYNTPTENSATTAAPETADLLVEICWDKPVVDEIEIIITITETAPVVWVTEHVGGPQQRKRDHDHVHQHVHNKIHKKRHGV
ncbi:MAG: hypothetical protein ASARMPREDX12_000355 [Alectoria sarmentosa]|nr:MAG: hypothetical protein ASARMPREDX12_000355 [Alectoria sarmentosa]